MKKAKLMLSSMAVLAVLATAFAFKAESFSKHVVYTGAVNQEGGATACTEEVLGRTFTTSGTQIRASIASTTVGCPVTFTTTINDNQ